MCSHVNFVVGGASDKCLVVTKLKSPDPNTVKGLVFRGVKISNLWAVTVSLTVNDPWILLKIMEVPYQPS